MNRKSICSQQVHCLSCPLSKSFTGKDCRELTQTEIHNIMSLFRALESLPIEFAIERILDEYLRKAKDMYIDDKWYSESEIIAYVHKLEAENAELRAVIARNSEEEYE